MNSTNKQIHASNPPLSGFLLKHQPAILSNKLEGKNNIKYIDIYY